MAWTLPSLAALGSLPASQSHYLRLILSEPHFRTSCLIVIGFHSKLPFIPAPSTLGSLTLPNLGAWGTDGDCAMFGVGRDC